MEESGIEATALKGVAHGWTVYDDPGIRHSKDIDLLADEQDAESADALLRESGYVRNIPPQNYWSVEADRKFRTYRSRYEYSVGRGNPQVELHWRQAAAGPGDHSGSGSLHRVELLRQVVNNLQCRAEMARAVQPECLSCRPATTTST